MTNNPLGIISKIFPVEEGKNYIAVVGPEVTRHKYASLLDGWRQMWRNSSVMPQLLVISSDMRISEQTDETLRGLGLMRIPEGGE